MNQIKNRIKESVLESFEISSVMPSEEIVGIDIKDQLWQGLVLKEKQYREWIKTHSWEDYQNKGVFIHCSSDAIVPSWAYLLILRSILPYCSECILGTKKELLRKIIKLKIQESDLSKYKDKRILLKGCSDAVENDFAFFEITKALIPICRSIMFGEACSNVPIFKKKRGN